MKSISSRDFRNNFREWKQRILSGEETELLITEYGNPLFMVKKYDLLARKVKKADRDPDKDVPSAEHSDKVEGDLGGRDTDSGVSGEASEERTFAGVGIL